MVKLEINRGKDERIDGRQLEAVIDVARKVLKIRKNQEISLAFVAPQAIRKINKTYRGKDSVTDVLSFEEFGSGPFIGEILICLPQARKQAKEVGWSLKNELDKLLLHGYLHLIGYDHEKMADAKKMEKIEDDILRKLSE